MPHKYGEIIRHEHHDIVVMVREGLKGTHREHCLCYGCQLFKPNQVGNCHTAQALFELCQEHGLTTPVFECSSCKPGEPDLAYISAR